MFNGPSYDPQHDKDRLKKQMGRIFDLMIDGRWRTLFEISNITGDPESSVSAQLRHLRKERFGAYVVERRRRGDPGAGLWEYSLSPPIIKFNKTGQGEFLYGQM